VSSSLPPLSSDSFERIAYKDNLKQACEGFEALFLNTLLREGRGNSSVSISSSEGRAMGILNDLRDDAVSKEMAKSGGLGLGQMLYQSLSKKAQVSSSTADNLGERRNSP
jgi:Rod binding domain-containing protein